MKTLNKAMIRLQVFRMMMKEKLKEGSGEFVMNDSMRVVYVLVFGGIIITLVALYLRGTLSESLKAKINDLLNFN